MFTYESYKHLLIHNPERQWKKDPNILVEESYSNDLPTFSIVMPIHNQEKIINDVLSSIILTTIGKYEIILILDGCTDNTKEIVLKWRVTLPKSCVKLLIIENEEGIFETSCDNQGFVLSRGKYIIEVQADMQILTIGYNIFLCSPMEICEDLIAISGRCCHGLNDKTKSLNVGKLGELTKFPHKMDFSAYSTIYLSHTVNRGPLALRREMLHSLGYLDEKHYVLGDDEHDLFTRAYHDYKWRTGFVMIEVYSPDEWGSTRKEKSTAVRAYLSKRESNMKDGFLSKVRSTFKYPIGETRILSSQQKITAYENLI